MVNKFWAIGLIILHLLCIYTHIPTYFFSLLSQSHRTPAHMHIITTEQDNEINTDTFFVWRFRQKIYYPLFSPTLYSTIPNQRKPCFCPGNVCGYVTLMIIILLNSIITLFFLYMYKALIPGGIM